MKTNCVHAGLGKVALVWVWKLHSWKALHSICSRWTPVTDFCLKIRLFWVTNWIICVWIRWISSEDTSTDKEGGKGDKHKAWSFNVLYNFDWTLHNENALQYAKTMSELVDSYQPRTVWGQTSSSLLPLVAACGGRLEQFLFPEM